MDTMTLVEQHTIKRSDSRFRAVDEAAFKAKNLYNAANYVIRQSFLGGNGYIPFARLYHLMKEHEAYSALPRVTDYFLEQAGFYFVLKDQLQGVVFAPQDSTSRFWQSLENRWGRGPGYKQDSISMYRVQLADANIPGYLNQQARQRWSSFLDGILAFFG